MKTLYTYLSVTVIYTANLFAQAESPLTFPEQLNNLKNGSGIGIEFNYKGEVYSNTGGMDQKEVYLDNIDIIFDFDLEHLISWKGARLNTHILGNHGGDPGEHAGVAQGISNIAAHETWKIYQFFFEQEFYKGDLSILAGLYDLNSEFDVRETSGIFINPSHGIGPDYALTGHNGPSIFPTTSLALRVKYKISSLFDIKAAVFDGVPGNIDEPNGTEIVFHKHDGLLISTELTYKSVSEDFNAGYHKVSIGGWYYTSEFEKLEAADIHGNPLMHKGNYGAYISAEKFLFGENDHENQGLAGFIRLGLANHDVNQVDGYFGAGLCYTGLIPGRDEDVIGLALASIHNNSSFINIMALEDLEVQNFEHILELTYIFNLTEWLTIQPDIQYAFNPVNCNCNDYSFVYGTRLELAF